ncbi:MAG: hypothetical protein VR72_17235 [Clostridiaceae bacterium BRH_c20a]|nr:MAG: hypothetical protein VR72_17235 [Clostridiaceae bacterium BRH_c20a]
MVGIKEGLVFNIQRYSIHDGPGIRTVVFLKGCPLRCVWCSNPESQNLFREKRFIEKRCINCKKCISICPVNAMNQQRVINLDKCLDCGACIDTCYSEALQYVGNILSDEEILEEVKKDLVFYKDKGGITLSGGEPLLQNEFVSSLLRLCKKSSINTVVETSGFVKWDTLNELAELIDLFYYDIKHINSKIHNELTGKPNELIVENLEKLLDKKRNNVIVRIPLIKGMNCDFENISGIGVFLKKINYHNEVHLLPYHRFGTGKYKQLDREYLAQSAEIPTENDIRNYSSILEQYHLTTKVY